MVETRVLGLVFGSALLAWLLALLATDGWTEPPILFWSFVLTVGAATVLYLVDVVDLPR
jgi:uncharacterized membrane protein YeaQ/YmgE (transglycosylase-associated protein family)